MRAIALAAADSVRSPAAFTQAGRGSLEWLCAQAAIEWEYGRVVLWLAPAFALGILLQATASRTPALWAGPLILLLAGVLTWKGRAHLAALVVGSAITAVAAGFSAASLQEDGAAGAPVLRYPFRGTVSGTVESVEPRLRDQRVILRVARLGEITARNRPKRVRISVGKSARIEPGDRLRLTATWRPPPGPSAPGGYDAAYAAFMQGIGAFGFAAADIKVRRPVSMGLSARIERVRLDLTRRIDSASGGGAAGAISAALVTGIRGAIPTEAEDAMRNAGLTHLLSISGTHLALVAGVLFFAVRALLALFPGLALRRPIKSWAALAALCGTSCYLVLSGAAVATQRSFLMSAIVLVAVVAGRPALTMRNVALAAVVVLALSPATLLGPSLEMSFAAVLAIVAGFEAVRRPEADPVERRRLALGWFGRFLLAAVATTVLAGLATAPFAAFHFHRVTPYALLGNMLALPLVSFWIMPAGVLGALLVPFGLDGFAWALMGAGVEAMLAVARLVADLPGAERFVPAFGEGALLCLAVALLIGTLSISQLRFVGLPIAALGLWLAGSVERPVVLIDPEGRAAAVRGPDGRLQLLGVSRTALTGRSWLQANGEAPAEGRAPKPRCPEEGCFAPLPDGRTAALVEEPAGFAARCRAAALIVTRLRAPEDCRRTAVVIDRSLLEITGALALSPRGDGFAYVAARPPDRNRLWYGRSAEAQRRALHLPRVLHREAAAAQGGASEEASPNESLDDLIDPPSDY